MRTLSVLSRQLVAAVLVVSLFSVSIAKGAEPSLPNVEQADIDALLEHFPLYLEMRTLPASEETRKKFEDYGAEHALDIDRFALASTKILLAVAMESGLRTVAILTEEIPDTMLPSDTEMDLIRRNLAAIVAAIAEHTDANRADIQERMKGDRLALEIYLVATTLYSSIEEPERTFSVLIDYILPEREALWEAIIPALVDSAKRDNAAAASRFKTVLDQYSAEELGAPTHAFLLRTYAVALGQQGRFDEALTMLASAWERYRDSDDSAVIQQNAVTLFTHGLWLMQLGRTEEALTVYVRLTQTYRDRPEPVVMHQVASAYNNQAVIHAQNGRVAQALASFDACIERFQGEDMAPVIEMVARVAVAKGVMLLQANRIDESDEVFAMVIDRYASHPIGVIAKHAVIAANNRILVAEMREDPEAADREMRRMVDTFGNRTEPEVLEWVGKALHGRGMTAAQEERMQDAEEAFRLLAATESLAALPELRELLASNMWYLGITYCERKEFHKALAILEQMIDRFEHDNDPKIQAHVAQSMSTIAYAHSERGEPESEVEAYRRLIDAFIENKDIHVAEKVASGMRFGAETLLSIGQADEAFDMYNQLIERYGPINDVRLSVDVMHARTAVADPSEAGKIAQVIAFTIRRAERHGGDVPAVLDDLIQQHAERTEPVIEAAVAQAMVDKARYLAHDQKNEDAIAVCTEILRRYGESADEKVRLPVLMARSLLAAKHAEIGNRQTAIDIYKDIVTEYESTNDAILRSYVRGAVKQLKALEHDE